MNLSGIRALPKSLNAPKAALTPPLSRANKENRRPPVHAVGCQADGDNGRSGSLSPRERVRLRSAQKGRIDFGSSESPATSRQKLAPNNGFAPPAFASTVGGGVLLMALCALLISSPALRAARGPLPDLNTTTPYLVYYGNWDLNKLALARANYRLVILHPLSNIRPAQIDFLRRGPDNVLGTADDVRVFGYVSVGEDDRPGAPVAGDGLGPRVDPRSADNVPLSSITNALGLPSPKGTGYASYYLDTKSAPDGVPDRNPTFGGCFVNAGAPAWWDTLKTMTQASDGRSGLDEILTPNVGIGYDCDGVFLDTIDTAAPNSFGGTAYEWTAPGMRALVECISTNYPNKLIMGNRGLFFFNPNFKQYAYTLRPHLNAIMFESYFTDSDNSSQITPSFPFNKFDTAPKLNAEAGRPDGFSVVALGYDHSPALPQAVIDQDYLESMGVQGWPLYRTNPQLDAAFNTVASAWIAAHPDTQAPIWDNTAGQTGVLLPPRVGVQEVVPVDQGVTLRWDVARNQTGPVRYNIYYTAQSVLDFLTATKLAQVTPLLPTNYASGTGPGIYPYEFTVTGLSNGLSYRFAVRAEDSASPSHEDTNLVVLSAVAGVPSVPSFYRHIAMDGSFSDWSGVPDLATAAVAGSTLRFATVAAANDDNYLYLRFTLLAPALPFANYNTHLFVDTDNLAATGYPATGTGIGSELLIESGAGYDERNGTFNAGSVKNLNWLLRPAGSGTNFELRLSRQAQFADNSNVFTNALIRFLLQDNGGSFLLPQGILYQFASVGPYEQWQTRYFTPTELTDPAISGDAADPDRDHIPNLVEYAFNLNPRVPDHPTLPRAFWETVDGQPHLCLQFTRRNPPAAIEYVPQLSTNLLTWADSSAEFSQTGSIDQEDGTALVTLRLLAPLAANLSPLFLRIAIRR